MRMALAESAVDFYTLGDIIDASADEGEALHAQLSPGKAIPLRLLIAVEQPKTQEPKPAKPQCPGVHIGETARSRLALNFCRVEADAHAGGTTVHEVPSPEDGGAADPSRRKGQEGS